MTQLEIVQHHPIEELIVNYPPWHHARSQKPRSFEQFVDMVCASEKYAGKIKGIWELIQTDMHTGEIVKRLWNMNVVTDSGADKILKRAINSASATLPNLFNQMAITDNSGSTTLQAALTSGNAYTTLTVAALPAAIPATTGGVATTLVIGFGTGQTQTVTLSAGASAGATSISVTSFTANANYAIGTAVVPNPHVAEDPTSLAGAHVSYSGAMATGAFTYTPTTGTGNRTLVASQLFQNGSGTNTPVGFYTDVWIVNTNPVAGAGQTVAHEINTPMRCDLQNTVTANATIKI
jgi:hypothetical protein